MAKKKMYVIRKYVMAKSVSAALRQEKNAPVHEVFVDDAWTKGQNPGLADAIGFRKENDDE